MDPFVHGLRDVLGDPCAVAVSLLCGLGNVACCPNLSVAVEPDQDVTFAAPPESADARDLRLLRATMSLWSATPDSEIPVLVAGDPVGVLVELTWAVDDISATVAVRREADRVVLWSSGTPAETAVRVVHRQKEPSELRFGVFLPDATAPHCAVVELDIVQGQVARRWGTGGPQAPTDAQLEALPPGAWTRLSQPVLVVPAAALVDVVDEDDWQALTIRSEQCGVPKAATI